MNGTKLTLSSNLQRSSLEIKGFPFSARSTENFQGCRSVTVLYRFYDHLREYLKPSVLLLGDFHRYKIRDLRLIQ